MNFISDTFTYGSIVCPVSWRAAAGPSRATTSRSTSRSRTTMNSSRTGSTFRSISPTGIIRTSWIRGVHTGGDSRHQTLPSFLNSSMRGRVKNDNCSLKGKCANLLYVVFLVNLIFHVHLVFFRGDAAFKGKHVPARGTPLFKILYMYAHNGYM